jgi:hypothetical protein
MPAIDGGEKLGEEDLERIERRPGYALYSILGRLRCEVAIKASGPAPPAIPVGHGRVTDRP